MGIQESYVRASDIGRIRRGGLQKEIVMELFFDHKGQIGGWKRGDVNLEDKPLRLTTREPYPAIMSLPRVLVDVLLHRPRSHSCLEAAPCVELYEKDAANGGGVVVFEGREIGEGRRSWAHLCLLGSH